MPAQVLSLFGSGREEDKMVGYLSFLKIGPKLLKFLPGAAGGGGDPWFGQLWASAVCSWVPACQAGRTAQRRRPRSPAH